MKKLALVLGVALVASGLAFFGLLRASQAERRQTQELEARLVALESVRHGKSGLQGASQPSGFAGDMPSGEQSGAGVVSGNGQSAAASSSPLWAVREQMLNTPEGREFARSMLRMGMDRQYPDVGKELGLSPEQVDRVFDLLAERAMDVAPDLLDARSGPDAANREEMGRLLHEKEQAHEAELSALLGERYPQWKEYERSAGQRQQDEWARREREQLRAAMSPPGNALNDAQFQSLHAALEAERRRINQESRGYSVQQEAQHMPEAHRRLIEVASGYLNAQQLEGYRRHLQQEADMASMMATMERAMGGED